MLSKHYNKPMRLNRYIARSGITSRRKAEELILASKVMINDVITTELGTTVKDTDKVTVNDKPISVPDYVYYAFNKPTGYATTKSDPHESHTIFELLPNDSSLFAIGRLDRNTSGLLLITNDGDFAQNIIHPTKKIEKEYIVRTKNLITNDQLESLGGGVELDDGLAEIKKVEKLADKEISLVIEMGRKRVVRRLLKAVGNEVVGLSRKRIGKINLDIPTGKYRPLSKEEVELYA